MNTPNWKHSPKSTVKQRTILPPGIWSIFYETCATDGEGNIILSVDDFEELEGCIEQTLQENHNLRRMLYHMTSLTDWLREGYSEAEYNAIVSEFGKEE